MTGAGIVIRERRSAELGACIALLALVHTEDAYPANWPEDPASWLTPKGEVCTWVAEDYANGGIVGHVMVRDTRDDATAAFVSRFFVSPTSRGLGLGQQLLTRAREWAIEHRRQLRLEVDGSSAAAIAVYERGGWQRTGSYLADWTTPAGDPVTMIRYALPVA